MAMPDVSDRWIKISYWFLSNRKDLTRWWVLLLIAFDIFLLVYVVTNGAITLITYANAQKMVSSIGTSRVISTDVTSRSTPQPIAIIRIDSIPESTASTLVIARIKNPNAGWSAENVTYHFTESGRELESRTTFLLPLEERVLVVSEDITSKPSLTISHVAWKRTPQSTLPKVAVTFSEGLHEFVTTKSGPTQKTISQITTLVTNKSLYGITQLKGIVLVANGQQIVGARQFFIDALKAKEAREVTIQFPDPLPPFTSISFSSEVNTLDPTNLTP